MRYHNVNADCIIGGSYSCDPLHHFITVLVNSFRFYMADTQLKQARTKEQFVANASGTS